MDALQMMRVFARVAQRASFAAAAEELRMSRASVTKHVAAIEERHGVRLLDRTTRSVSVTEAGRVYLERCLECLQAYEDSEAAIGRLAAEPRGLLRVAGPFDLNRHLPRLVAEFMKAHPAIDVELLLSNRTLDMVDAGIDVYLRVTNSLPPDLVARQLAITRFAVWGAPSYFRKQKRPRTPLELSNHRFALFNEPPLLDEWVFERDGKRVKVRLKPRLMSNAGEAHVAAAIEGVALAVFPSFLLPADSARRLEPVLLDWSLGHRGVHAVYPHRRFVPAKVRAFVDYLRAALGDGTRDPWWPAAIPLPGSLDIRAGRAEVASDRA
ncbi:MAG TPA: LysR family transcriptional regulator [Polyangiaceae bacterium]|nr:LysR family transcriptional regulator [Polyangiaceae bacterium]